MRAALLIALLRMSIEASTVSIPITGSGRFIWSPSGWAAQMNAVGASEIGAVSVAVSESVDTEAGAVIWSDQYLPYIFTTLPYAQGFGTVNGVDGADWLPPDFGFNLDFSLGGGPGFVAVHNPGSGQSASVMVQGFVQYTNITAYLDPAGFTDQVIADFLIVPDAPAWEPSTVLTTLLAICALTLYWIRGKSHHTPAPAKLTD